MAKNLLANAGDLRDTSSLPGSGRSPGRGHSNPFQYSWLENPMDRGAWWAAVLGVAKSQTRLKRLSMRARTVTIVVQWLSRVQVCNPRDCSTSGFPVVHHLSEFAQTHVH